MKKVFINVILIFVLSISLNASNDMVLEKTIWGNISPKSVVHSGDGLFFAQNMMYRHTLTVYNRDFELVKTISDKIKLSDYGFSEYEGEYNGAPVEIAFSHNGKYAWTSNYKMYGKGFDNPGNDKGTPEGNFDKSFLYKINTKSFEIENIVKVGAVPKYVAVTPDDRHVLVTNWCDYDMSVVDTETNKVVKTVYLGRFPRGIEISADSKTAYVAVMGSYDIGVVDLDDYSVKFMKGIGRSPRHLCLHPDGKYLYATLNGEGKVAKIDLETEKVIHKIETGDAPRSMVLSGDGKYLYVVNYLSDSMSKVDAETMKVIQTVKTKERPIGITYDNEKNQVWVACYRGAIMIFQD
ncbi:MAG: cytochrome D1 domain-containing protein [Bacteroidales bacterium]